MHHLKIYQSLPKRHSPQDNKVILVGCRQVFYPKVPLKTIVPIQVLKALDGLGTVKAEEELQPVQKLLSEAYKEIDKAVLRGVLHKNTGNRRKSRLARARQKLLIASGLYTPTNKPKAAWLKICYCWLLLPCSFWDKRQEHFMDVRQNWIGHKTRNFSKLRIAA